MECTKHHHETQRDEGVDGKDRSDGVMQESDTDAHGEGLAGMIIHLTLSEHHKFKDTEEDNINAQSVD